MSDNAILAALRRMGIEKTEMTGHGFRAAARTILDEVLGSDPTISSIGSRMQYVILMGVPITGLSIYRNGGS